MPQTRLPDPDVGDGAAATADPRRWKALALLAVVNFMVILDSQIVILALLRIESRPVASTACPRR